MSQPPGHSAFPLPNPTPRTPPDDVPAQPTTWQIPEPKRDRNMIAVLVAGGLAFLAVAAVVVVVAMKSDGDKGTDAAARADRPPALVTTGDTWSRTTSRPTSTSATLPSPSSTAVTSGYRRVPGPNGISAELPSTWLVKAGTQPTNIQADNPDSPGSLIRIGGSPSDPLPLLDAVAGNETQNSGISNGYQRLRLERVNGDPDAVVWEFLYAKDGEPKHSFGRYWRIGGVDYIVYGSASAAAWPAMKTVLDVVVRTTTM